LSDDGAGALYGLVNLDAERFSRAKPAEPARVRLSRFGSELIEFRTPRRRG